MSVDLKKAPSNGCENLLTSDEQQAKINEVRRLIGPLPDKLSIYCSDASISRYLWARNWNVKKATKMLKDSLKWRLTYKPEEICWEDVAHEAETGKIYRSNSIDKHGRTVLVMRPSRQNSKSTKGQIKYLVYCMENAVLNLSPGQEQMVWLIDFEGFNLSNISVKVVKPFLEPKTYNKVKFVYADDNSSKKVMEDLFDMDQLESAFGGNDSRGFDINEYAERMREDDKRRMSFWTRGNPPPASPQPALTSAALDSLNLESDSDASVNEKIEGSPSNGVEPEVVFPGQDMLTTDGSKNAT
ncbi:uncharacterized protein LOC133853699 isoform X2 [Alnus glutinosa]|uniref:uncharacterized protein LOC133853699 isoform X2 n=1 Tax=Alnus glutinosa TaxID=3517 RepID=UPI002D764ADF|nr:uncharacterized protein LOC133853699 isoform X2 [Alnus glutinosa]